MKRITVFALVSLMVLAFSASTMAFGLEDFTKADIDWKQFAGETVNVAVVEMFDTEKLAEQLPMFEELTGINVNLINLPESELHTKTLVDLASGAGRYDVILTDFMFLPQYAKAGFIEPLDKYINNPELTDKGWYNPDDFLVALWEGAQVDNRTVAVPLTVETTLLFYRKDLFAEAGLRVPKTYEELEKAAKTLHNPPAINGIGMRGLRGQGLNIYVWSGFFSGFGGEFFVDYPDDMTPTINTEAGIAATECYADLLRDYGPQGAANWDWAEVLAGLQQGKLAMAIDAIDFGPQIEDTNRSKTAGKWGYTTVPGGKGGVNPAIFSFMFTINSHSKHKEAAWLFSQFATSDASVYARAIQSGASSRASIWESEQFKENLREFGGQDYLDAATESYAEADPEYRPRFEHWREMGDILGIEVQAAISGEKSAEKAMNDAQEQIEKLMVREGYIK